MMINYTYLLIDFLAVIFCFVFSFDRRIGFHRHFVAAFAAIVIVAAPFICWDIWFAKEGIWWFNRTYTLGVELWGLPLEEWLFFVCIPFACLFTFYCLDKFFDLSWANGFNNILAFALSISCILLALLYPEKQYTFITSLATCITLVYLHFIARVIWVGQATFIFLVLMLGFIPVNGVLTGTGLASPIVNYEPKEFLGIRILTIPIEDFLYGYTQFLLNVYFLKIFQGIVGDKKYSKEQNPQGQGIQILLNLFRNTNVQLLTQAIDYFEPVRYLGKWYEIARLDFWFEKNLNQVTAHYSMREDGTIKVSNRGFDYVKSKWKSATGKAKFKASANIGALRVSFWGPFYSAYSVIAIDPEYQYALVVGKSRKYLWILSRSQTIPQEIKQDYLLKAEGLGYDISKIIWVKHKWNKTIPS